MPRFHRLPTRLPALLLVLVTLPAAAENIASLHSEQLMQLLSEEGYVPRLEEPRVVEVKIQSLRTYFFIAEDHASIQAYAGFEAPGAGLAEVNRWNRERRYSRAYIDDEGDPVIELDLDLVGGVSRERIADFIRTVRVSVTAFADHVFGAAPEKAPAEEAPAIGI